MQSLALVMPRPQGGAMSQPEDDDDAQHRRVLGRALAMLRDEAGLSQARAGEAYGVSGQNFAKYELGKAQSIFYPAVQRRLLQAVGASQVAWRRAIQEAERQLEAGPPGFQETATPFYWGRTDAAALPVRDRIQAAWVAETASVMARTFPASRDPRYPNAEQWLAEVVDDSAAGLSILQGDFAQCIDAAAINYFPKTGDIVEVERLRPDGDRELTLKQVEQTQSGVLLWPRPGQASRRDPIPLAANDGDAPRIRALVTVSLRRY